MSIPQRFHFLSSSSSNSLSPQFSSDIQNLNSFTETQLNEFVDIVFHYLTNQSTAAEQQLATFATTHTINLKPLKQTLQSLLTILSSALRLNLTINQLTSDFTALGLVEAQTQLLLNKWHSEYSKLASSAISQTLTRNELKNIEWRFGVTAASNELNKVGTTFLQLKLAIDNVNLGKIENITLELTLTQFYQFLSQMQAAARQAEAAGKQ